jgi:signal transduction histidine kinase/ligand-binding sensor domain-containing protein
MKCTLVFIAWVIWAGSLFAQVPSFQKVHYTTDNSGLSHNTVLNITKDSRGFIWVSTMDGLNRFDGKTMKIYKHIPGDSTTLSDSFIHGVYEREDGKLLISTRNGGFTLLDPVTDKKTWITHDPSKPGTIPNKPVSMVFKDQTGFFWVGFFDGGIGKLDEKTLEYTPTLLLEKHSGEEIKSVNAILEFDDGGFLFSSISGIYYIPVEELDAFRSAPNTETVITAERIPFSNEIPRPNTSALYLDKQGTLWIQLIPEGFSPLQRSQMTEPMKKSISSGWSRRDQYSYIVEKDGLIYRTGLEGQLEIFDKRTKSEYRVKLADEEYSGGASRLYQDPDGFIWFGSWGGGLYQLKEKKGIKLISKEMNAKRLPSPFMVSFEDEGENLWVGTGEGVALLNGNLEVQEIIAGSGLGQTGIWSLERDDLGLWIGTRTQGVLFISEDEISNRTYRIQSFNPENSLVLNRHVHQVFRDSRGWLWLGYEGDGIQVITNTENWMKGGPARVIHLTEGNLEGNRVHSNYIRRIYEDRNGDFWIASNDRGFARLRIEGEAITPDRIFSTSGNADFQIAHNDARSIHHQNDSTFWLATYGGGIFKWVEGKEPEPYSTVNGLANNNTYGILGDEDSRFIWVSTNNGLSRLDTQTDQFTNFTEKDGLQNNEFNTGAYLKRINGELVFGGVNGFNVIDTKELALNQNPPPVYLTEINLFNEPIPGDTTALFRKRLNLNYNENFLSFEFAALDFESPTENQFAYRMEGVDDDWVYSGNRNFADYPNLAPGSYSFRVKASNSDGFWSEEGTALSIMISPPWWQTTWFRLIFGAALLLGLISTVRYFSQRRLRKEIRKMEIENRLRGERERISRDLHDHVGAQLANIISGLSLIDKYNEFDEKEKSTRLMNNLKGDAEVTIKQLRETIWALNQNELDLRSFSDHLTTYFKSQSALTETLSVKIGVDGDETTRLSSTQALNLFRIVQEASQNTLKYANAENLNILFHKQNGDLSVIIKDDGKFKESGQSFNGGYGMKNMRKRAEEIGGSIEVNTSDGTEVRVKVKL